MRTVRRARTNVGSMDLRLDGKKALITGGSRGIGKAIAKAMVDSGAEVMITSRKAESCEETANEIGCIWEAGHVGRPEDAERIVAAAMDRLGGVDILVNNAGTGPYNGPTIDCDIPRWNKTFEVNLTAPLIFSQLCWNSYMKENDGVIINIASVGGFSTNEFIGVYDISKAALIHLTKQLGAELGPQVRVNALCPGLVKTDFAKFLWEGEKGDEVAQNYPLKRLGEPEDVAAAAVWLAAESGRWITGQSIVLDGGGMVKFPTV